MLGDGTTYERYAPVQVISSETNTPLASITKIAVGDYHTLALRSDGTVWSWGAGTSGQLGNAMSSNQAKAVQVKLQDSTPLEDVVEVAAGQSFSIALTDDGKVYTWGHNYFGKLGQGDNDYNKSVNYAVQIAGPGINDHVVQHIYTNSASDSAFYTVSGAVYGWGGNTDGQLGNGDYVDYVHGEAPVSTPIEIETFRDKHVLNIVSGDQHTLVLTDDHHVWGMGTDSYGELLHYSSAYDANVYQVFTPVELDSSLTDITAIGAGNSSSFAIRSDGVLLSFGNNRKWQLGLPKQTIHDADLDEKDDYTLNNYVDEDEDGVDDDYPYQAIKPLAAFELVDQSSEISGTAMIQGTNLPMGNVKMTLSSSVYGGLYAYTDEYGQFHFPHVLPGDHTLQIDNSYNTYYSMTNEDEVMVVSAPTSDIELTVTANWIPSNLQFTDSNEEMGYIAGTLSWNMPIYPLDSAIYQAVFIDHNGNSLGEIGTSEIAPFINISDKVVPSGAESIRLFVQSDSSYSLICRSSYCDTGLVIPLIDAATDEGSGDGASDPAEPAVQELSFFDMDLDANQVRGTITWTPLEDESDILKYAVYWKDFLGSKIGSAISEVDKTNHMLQIDANTSVPAGAVKIAVYAVDSTDHEIGMTEIMLEDSDRDNPDAYRLQLYKWLNPDMHRWSIDDTAAIINGQSVDITDDGQFLRDDVEELLQLIQPLSIHSS
ncbi:RCC1 domain-containing protein [Paenibacillus hexagrammi]|uniref:Uncharacterized protein n=1 Tax=Paenibacillus hexagrammi TaxID=2908839 RepID=A0ABY3SKD2_9BACL|nr:hypothetical protein [Paenibacillus sp. YPD9-1]UJF34421.1 hypothetical protein L0M14_04280 [Paenibacillus sp. YPD9-1]